MFAAFSDSARTVTAFMDLATSATTTTATTTTTTSTQEMELVCEDDPPGWVSSTGLSCNFYKWGQYCTESGGYGLNWDHATLGTFDMWAVDGVAADQACCDCGGGKSPWVVA